MRHRARERPDVLREHQERDDVICFTAFVESDLKFCLDRPDVSPARPNEQSNLQGTSQPLLLLPLYNSHA